MPIHDWSQAPDAVVHHFHLSWAVALSHQLNRGILPPPVFAMTETVELRPTAAFVELSGSDGPVSRRTWEERLPDAMDEPPLATFRACDDRQQYACRVVTVRDEDLHPVAAVLWTTRQDAETPYRRDALVQFAVGALTRGTHLLVIDVFHPARPGAKSFHERIWDRIEDRGLALPASKPLTLASYTPGYPLTAYIEPLRVGEPLPEMPLFLTGDRYVRCPLEPTYQACWDDLPPALRGPLDSPSGEPE